MLTFQNRNFKILTAFKILAFQNPAFEGLAFKISEFKILTNFKILAFQNHEFKMFAVI